MSDVVDIAGRDTFEEIFNTSVEGIMVVQDGKVMLANPQCQNLFGYSTKELIGMMIEEFVPLQFRSGHAATREHFMKSPSTRRMGVGRDLLGLRKDGSTFPVEISLSPAKVNDKISVIAHIIDISPRKKAEEDLKRSEEQLLQYATELEERVLLRTAELGEAVENLKKTNESLEAEIAERIKAENEAQIALAREKELHELKTRFVSMASHEFRTPLSTILSSTSLLAKYNSPETEEKRSKHITRIKNNVGELTSILNDFLSLDKLEAGKMSINLSDFDICELIEETISEMSTLTKRDQHILFDIQIKHCRIKSDPQVIKQILSNLLSNAIKYSGEDSEINVDSNETDDDITIAVVDQGIGIPENDQKHLFEKFFRAHNSSHIQGTGLGLNIVVKYLELLGGAISFESVEGKGATFTIKLTK